MVMLAKNIGRFQMLTYKFKSNFNTMVVRFKCLLNKCYHDIVGHKSYEVLIKEYIDKFILPYAGDNSEEYW